MPRGVGQPKRKKIHTIHTSSQLQKKKHHTGTEVMAKKNKKQNKTV
jgi:hypothetical protein